MILFNIVIPLVIFSPGSPELSDKAAIFYSENFKMSNHDFKRKFFCAILGFYTPQ